MHLRLPSQAPAFMLRGSSRKGPGSQPLPPSTAATHRPLADVGLLARLARHPVARVLLCILDLAQEGLPLPGLQRVFGRAHALEVQLDVTRPGVQCRKGV